jgi:Fe-Mn family superoxide dismutase
MHTYTAKTFTLPELQGISARQIEVHLGLYQGYVKHVNLLREQIADLTALDAQKYAYAIENLRRRLGWEFNGMRMHEFYFPQFEGGPKEVNPNSRFANAVIEKYGSWVAFIDHLKKTCLTRGPGWAVVSQDISGGTVHVSWTTEHEQGTLADTTILFAADMWEHAFMVDYSPLDKSKHIDAFLANINWSVVEARYKA